MKPRSTQRCGGVSPRISASSICAAARPISARGVRIFAPTHHFYTLPGIGRLFAQLETRYCDSALGRLGGYLVVELRAPSA